MTLFSVQQQETAPETAARKKAYWKRARWCNWVGFFLGALIVAPLMVMLFDRRQPIELHEGRLVPDVVRPGQIVTIKWKAKELAVSNGMFVRRFVDSCGTIHEQIPTPTIYRLRVVNPELEQEFAREFKMPEGLCQGEATYQTQGGRWRNVLQKIFWPIPFESPVTKFYVVKAKPEDAPLAPKE